MLTYSSSYDKKARNTQKISKSGRGGQLWLVELNKAMPKHNPNFSHSSL